MSGVDFEKINQLHHQAEAAEERGDLQAAASAYDRAIALLESECGDPPDQGSAAIQYELARAYMGRGIAYRSQNRLTEAIADYDRAIAHMEHLGEALGDQWPAGMRNSLARAYVNRGNAYWSQNRLTEAIADYDRAIAHMEHLGEALGDQWPAGMRNDLASAYVNRGNAYSDQNRLTEAIADYDRAIAHGEHLGEALGDQWPAGMRNDLASAYMGRGNAYLSQNRLTEAIADYDRAIAHGEHLGEALGEQWPAGMRNSLASAYMNRGTAYLSQNRLTEAIADHDRAIAHREHLGEALGEQWPAGMRNSLASAYMNRGVAYSDQNRLTEAIADYDRAIAHMERLGEALGEQWPAGMRNDLAGAYVNRGTAYSDQNRLTEAIADYDRAIAHRERLGEALGDQWPAGMRNDLAGAYMNRGNAYSDQNRLTEAIADYDWAIAHREHLGEALGDQWPAGMRNDLASAYVNRGNAYLSQNRLTEAIADYDRATTISEALPAGTWPEGDRVRLLIYANMAALLAHLPNAPAWARDKSRRMAETLELAPPMAEDYSEYRKMRNLFAQFHTRWLSHCIDSGQPEAIPEILAAIQGRDLAAEVLDRLTLEGPRASTPQAVRDYQALRLELRKINARIQAIISGGKGGSPGAGRGEAVPPAQAQAPGFPWEAYHAALEEHRSLFARLPELREKAAREPDYGYLLQPYARLSFAALQGSLARGDGADTGAEEALLLLLDPAEGRKGVLLIRREGPPHWHEAPDLGAIARRVRDFRPEQGRLQGYRRGALDAGKAVQTEDEQAGTEGAEHRWLGRLSRWMSGGGTRRVTGARSQGEAAGDSKERAEEIEKNTRIARFWDDCQTELREQLWQPLSGALEGVGRLICIPHGNLHLLPLDAGAPEGLQLLRYPGLAFFTLRRGLYGPQAKATEPTAALGLIAHSGKQGDIPLTEAESDAIAEHWRQRGEKTPIRQPSPYPDTEEGVRLLHIACHGGEDPHRAGHVILKTGGEEPLSMARILASRAPLRDLYISACLGGQTVEDDLDGTPSGLMSGFFRRHARTLVAALVSIPDDWSFLLALLTHQTLAREDCSLDRALAEAKRRLATGDWYPETATLLRRHGEPRSRDLYLQNIMAFSDHYGARAFFGICWEKGLDPILARHRGMPAEQRRALRQRLAGLAPEALADAFTTADMDYWLNDGRIPPQPALGTLLYGVVPFGEGGAETPVSTYP